jgi:prefoldin beta subunit
MNISPENEKKIEELRALEQNFQNFSMQKQNLQIELNEISTSLEELKKAKSDVFKVLGGVMIKSTPEILTEELKEKEKISSLHLQTVEKQEKMIEEKALELREDLNKTLAKKE